MNKLEYYRLEKTPECKDFYFTSEGMDSFWNEYLICRIKDKNIVIVNRPGTKFEHFDAEFTDLAASNMKQEIKERFCGARGCNCATDTCPIVSEWKTCLQLL